MPRRTTPLIAGEYYHIYNRGNNRSNIFFEQENYLFFLQRLREYVVDGKCRRQTSEVSKTSEVSQARAAIIAYCLMPNHYHLLVQPNDDVFSHRFQNFIISYTKAINQRFERVGALFQGVFQAKRVDREEYLVSLAAYIHLNPVRAGMTRCAEDWPFSSYRDYVGLRQGTLIRPAVILQHFESPHVYQESVERQTSEVSKTSEVYPQPWKRIAHLLPPDE